MNRTITLLLLAVALAGCSDEPELSREGGHTHGAIHTCPDGTRLDPGDFGDHHDADFDIAAKCPAKDAPAATFVTLPASSATAYDALQITWDAIPGGGGDHIMHTGIHYALDGGTPGADPDSWGTLIDEQTHQFAPIRLTATFSPEMPGTYTLRSFAQATNNGPYVWSEPVTLDVRDIEPSGVEETVTIDFGLPTASLSDDSLQLRAGDAVVFINNDVRAHAIDGEGPAAFSTGELAANGGASEAIVLLRAGNYDYSNADGTLTGRITVLAPS